MERDYVDLVFEKEGSIATLTLNRPEKLNAFTGMMRQGLWRAVEDVGQDDDIRVLIITGEGKGFCSGADINSMLAVTPDQWVIPAGRGSRKGPESQPALMLQPLVRRTSPVVLLTMPSVNQPTPIVLPLKNSKWAGWFCAM